MRGVIYVDSFSGAYAFRKDDLFLLQSLSGPVAGVMEKVILYDLLNKESDSDKK
jgi:hypothetical protein